MFTARLLDLLSAGALKAGDKRYDPNLAKTLMSASNNKRQDGDAEDGAPTNQHTPKIVNKHMDTYSERKEKPKPYNNTNNKQITVPISRAAVAV